MANVQDHFNILLVCTGNVCRSPVAQLLLTSWLNAGEAAGFAVASAGTRALADRPMEPHAAALLPHGIDATGFHARQLTTQMVREADVVLCLDRENRSETVSMVPSALKRVFTLREFGRMLRLMDRELVAVGGTREGAAERWRKRVAAAPAVRPWAIAQNEKDDDVADPFGRSAHHYAEMMRQLEPALVAIWDAEQKFRR